MLYWKMYLRSAWGENITLEDFLVVLGNLIEDDKCVHSFKQCSKRLLRIVFNKLVINPANYVKMIAYHVYFIIKYKFSGQPFSCSVKYSQNFSGRKDL